MGNLPTILIRADAGVAMGTGHAMRCLALAQAWQDAGGRAVFAMVSPPGLIRGRLLEESFEVFEIGASPGSDDDAELTSALASQHDASWIVVDGYQFGAEYQRVLKSKGARIIFVDDYGHADHYSADVVLNQNISATESIYVDREPYTQLLLGPKYCLLRREFAAWRKWRRKIAPIGHRALVTMGGSDPENVTQAAIRALSLLEDEQLEAAVVVGGSNQHSELLEKFATSSGKKINIFRNVSNMSELMAWADVAVSAAGTTSWEMCVMGLPAILITAADNQISIARELSRRGCALHVGDASEITDAKLSANLSDLLRDKNRRSEISLRCRELIDGNGAERVVKFLLESVGTWRPAESITSSLEKSKKGQSLG